jgi:hypothetical protein
MGIGAEAFVTESDASVSSSSSSSSLSSKTTVLATVQAMLLNDYPDVAMRLRFATYLDEIAAATDVSSPSSLSSPPTAADATAGLAPPGISLSGVYPQTIIGRTICFGGTEGGEEIRLQGSGFARAAKWVLAKRIAETDGLAESLAAQEEAVDVRVLIGRFPCTAVRVVSDSEIVATTPCIVGEASCAAETAAAEEGSVLVKLPSSVTVIIGGIVRSDGSLRDRYNSFFQFERRAVEESASEEGGSSGDEIAEAGGATAADAAAADAAAAAAAAAAPDAAAIASADVAAKAAAAAKSAAALQMAVERKAAAERRAASAAKADTQRELASAERACFATQCKQRGATRTEFRGAVDDDFAAVVRAIDHMSELDMLMKLSPHCVASAAGPAVEPGSWVTPLVRGYMAERGPAALRARDALAVEAIDEEEGKSATVATTLPKTMADYYEQIESVAGYMGAAVHENKCVYTLRSLSPSLSRVFCAAHAPLLSRSLSTGLSRSALTLPS